MPSRAEIEPSGLGREIDLPEASRGTALLILSLGVAFDLAFNGQQPGASIPLFVIALAAALRPFVRRSFESDVLLFGAAVFAVFPALWASEELIALNCSVVAGLLGLAVTQDVGPASTVGVFGLIRRGIAIPRRSLTAARFLSAPLSKRSGPDARTRWRSSFRLAAVALPILVVFAALLASGDRVFARLLGRALPDWNMEGALVHLLIAAIGVSLVAILWRVAAGDGTAEHDGLLLRGIPRFSHAESLVVLGGIVVLFTAFVAVQFAYLFGGRERVNVTPGLTYAEYARSGFFQLAAAAALTIAVILATWDLVPRDSERERRSFRWLVTGIVSLTGVVLASALMRLALYEGAFGFTINRFFGYVAICGMGAVLLLLLGTIWTGRRDVLVAGSLAAALAALLVVNVMNPERFVATRNAARFDAIGRIDVDYLGWGLGADAVPIATSVLKRLSGEDAETLFRALCERLEKLGPEPSWRSANLGRESARDALRRTGIDAARCRTS